MSDFEQEPVFKHVDIDAATSEQALRDVWRKIEAFNDLVHTPGVDDGVSDAIMRNARNDHMYTMLTWFGEDGKTAVGNAKFGYGYYDADGNLLEDVAEPFRLLGTSVVLHPNGDLEVDNYKEDPNDNT